MKYINSRTYFLSLNSRAFIGPDMYSYHHLIVFQKKKKKKKEALRTTFTGNPPVGKHRKRWEDAASLLQCRNWKLTGQELREATARI
jgi:hypothetical protein